MRSKCFQKGPSSRRPMRGQAVADGARAYGTFLLRTLLFPLAWMWALAVARRHRETDPRAVARVGTAIVLGVVLAVGVTGLLWMFQQDARSEMYDALDGRLAVAVGESEYQDQVARITAAEGQLDTLGRLLAEAEEAGEEENATTFRANIEAAQVARAEAMERRDELEPAHALYGRVSDAVQAQDDGRAKQIVAGADYDYPNMDANSARAFGVKDDAVQDMRAVMVWLLYPGVVGVLFAPLAIALGSVLRTVWEPSESVGFKPYPGRALGLFLLMGAFGVPALFFAAWGFWDMDVRSTTGQISV